jgi:SAM-dependent methyltransferase
LPDLRLASDRYLDLRAERAKAERLDALAAAPGSDVMRVAAAYYAMTDDVLDARRERFLRHIRGAEARGAVLASRLAADGPVLEIGCGTGGLLVAAAQAGHMVAGVDIAARWLVVARRRLADHGLRVPLIAAQAERLPWKDAMFSCVVADSVLEHLDDPGRALAEWLRVLRPGGSLVVWSPNRYTLLTDPHVGLWGIGLLPRRWLPGYLKFRGRCVWPPRVLSAREALGLARCAGFARLEIGPPEVSREWARSRPSGERLAIAVYDRLRRISPTRKVLETLGPLWELKARAPRSMASGEAA